MRLIGMWSRTAALLLVITLASVVLATPEGLAKKKKSKHLPSIDFAVASYEEADGTVGIAVKVRRTDGVSIRYQGVPREAAPTPAQDYWWETRFEAPAQQCYPVVVRAVNRRGAVKRSIGAGLVGTPGCGGFGRGGGPPP